MKNWHPFKIHPRYNRVNGIHASENKFLLNDILRKDWGFKGTIMSDWFGTYSVDHSMNAGLDLEMPGPNKWRTVGFVNTTVISRKLLPRTIKRRAASVLDLVQKCVKASPAVLSQQCYTRIALLKNNRLYTVSKKRLKRAKKTELL